MPPFFIQQKKNRYLMKKSYLNSEINSAISLKPSMTIRLLLMVYLCRNVADTANISSKSDENWSSSSIWYAGVSSLQRDAAPINGSEIII